MDAPPPKRGRGRPRKYPVRTNPNIDAGAVSNSSSSSSSDAQIPELPITSQVDLEIKSEAELESELKSLMEGDAVNNLVYVPNSLINDGLNCTFDSLGIDQPTDTSRDDFAATVNKPATKSKKVKPMTKTSKKLLKFGYTGILRMADTVTKGKIPGERAVMLLQNDRYSDELLDEILAELDDKHHIEKYLNPESKLGLFTLQLLYTAKQE